jgi:ribosomal protein S30
MPPKEYEIVDPLALILRPEIYVILHLPDPPPDLRARVQEVTREMSAKDRQQALGRVKNLAAYTNAVIKALSGMEGVSSAA